MPLISGRKSLSQTKSRNFVLRQLSDFGDCFRCDRLYPIDWVVSVCAKKLISPEGRWEIKIHSRVSYLRARFDCEFLNMRIDNAIVDVTLGPGKFQLVLHIA